ncbi:MAG: 3'-5' exoribonuclease YhaM family protein [Lachnospiraceae bacterium]
MRYIKDCAPNSSIQGVYLCKQKISTETKNGKPYDSITLMDKTGVLDGKVWEPYSPGIREYEAGDFIEVYGEVILFNNAKQAKITRISKVEPEDVDMADYMPSTSKNIEEMFQQILDYIASVKNPSLNKLLMKFFVEDGEFVKKFKHSSAAKSVHHGFVGGLLEHTLSVTNLCDYYCKAYPILNRDLLIAAAICHDIGKVKELSDFPANDYTDEGQLLGHIVMGMEMVSAAIKEIPDFPEKLSHELCHCILSHHGELEYGSPKKPALIEAVALNFADNTDAKMETFKETLENSESRDWLGFQKFLDSNVRRTSIS